MLGMLAHKARLWVFVESQRGSG